MHKNVRILIIIILLGVNVDFGRLFGRVLNDEEHFGDEFNDVTRL